MATDKLRFADSSEKVCKLISLNRLIFTHHGYRKCIYTVVLLFSGKERIVVRIYFNSKLLEQVNSFRYLGSIITDIDYCSKDIRIRL